MENNSGFILLHRKILEWEWISDNSTFHFFITCLLLANYENKRFKGIEIKRGSFMTSISSLCEITGLSKPTVKKCLSKLVKSGEITDNVVPNRYRIISIKNYDKYQRKQDKKVESKRNKYKGFIFLNRKILTWENYKKAEICNLFIALLLFASFNDNDKVDIGEINTTYLALADISKILDISIENMQSYLDILDNARCIYLCYRNLTDDEEEKLGKIMPPIEKIHSIRICDYEKWACADSDNLNKNI